MTGKNAAETRFGMIYGEVLSINLDVDLRINSYKIGDDESISKINSGKSENEN